MSVLLAGGKLPADRVLDGKDPLPAFTGTGPSKHETLFFKYRKYQAVRQGRYKLLQTAPNAEWQLFDLKTDLGETMDLAAKYPDLTARLQQHFDNWLADTKREP